MESSEQDHSTVDRLLVIIHCQDLTTVNSDTTEEQKMLDLVF